MCVCFLVSNPPSLRTCLVLRHYTHFSLSTKCVTGFWVSKLEYKKTSPPQMIKKKSLLAQIIATKMGKYKKWLENQHGD